MLSLKRMFRQISVLGISSLLVFPIGEHFAIQSSYAESVNETQAVADPDSDTGVDEGIPAEVTEEAVKIGQSVVGEEPDLRNEFSTTYKLSDGTYIAQVFSNVQNYQDETGKWQKIQTDLIDEADVGEVMVPVSKEASKSLNQQVILNKKFQAKKPDEKSKTNFKPLHVPFDAVIPKDYADGYSIGKGDDHLAFLPVGANPTRGKWNRLDNVKYENAWTNTDVDLTVQTDGIKETITLKDISAPTKFAFEVQGILSNTLQSGLLSLSPAWLEDANGEKRNVFQSILKEDEKTFVVLNADVSGLTYPILIDPTVTVSSAPSASGVGKYVTNNSLDSFDSNYLIAGGNNSKIYRSYLKFSLSSIPAGMNVSNATLQMYNTNSSVQEGSNYQLSVYPVIANWTSVSWNSQPSYNPLTVDTAEVSGGSGWYEWDVTSLVSKWVNGSQSNYGLVLKGSENEFSTDTRSFYSGSGSNPPTLMIQYTLPLNSPKVLSPNGGEVWNSMHTITWQNGEMPLTTYDATTKGLSVYSYGSSTSKVAQLFKTSSTDLSLQSFSYKHNTSLTNKTFRISIYDTDGKLPVNEVWGKDVTLTGDYITVNPDLSLLPESVYAVVLTNFDKIYSVSTNPVPDFSKGIAVYGGTAWSSSSTSAVSSMKWVFTTRSPNQLQHQIQVTTDNGANWSDIVPLTPKGATSYSFDFTPVTPTTQAKVRIRTYDGFGYGSWDESDGVFTLHQTNSSSGLSPGSTNSSTPSLVGTTAPTLNWSFLDSDPGDNQSQFHVLIYSGSNIIHDSGWINSSASTYNVPAGLLNRNGIYNWKVQTKDNTGAISPLTNPYYFKINSLPTVSITSYSDGQTLSTNLVSLTWSYNDADAQTQTNFQILGSQNNWASIGYDSGIQNGSGTSFNLPSIANGTWSFKLLVRDGLEWSQAATRNNLILPNNFEPNDSFSQATEIGYNQTFSTFVETATDIDFYKYTASTSGINNVVMNIPTSANYDVYIYDENYYLIASGIRDLGQSEDVLYNAIAGKTYYIKVFGVGGSYSKNNPYSIKVSRLNHRFETTYEYDSNGNITKKTTTQISQ